MKNIILKPAFFYVCIMVAGVLPSSAQTLLKADSLFLAKDWLHAKTMYETVLKDTTHNPLAFMRLGFSSYHLGDYSAAMKNYDLSLAAGPKPPVKGILLWRRAEIFALRNEKQKACAALEDAFNNGYSNLQELDSLKDFSGMDSENCFKALREKVYAATYPCMKDAHAREFDFWLGDWDVYVTGTKTYAGHNTILMISGGCALLENWENSAGNGKSINYIDPVTNKWKQAWAGSYSNGIQEFVNGEYKDGAMRFVFETKDAKGNKQTGRFIFYNRGPDEVRQFNETSSDGGKTWVTAYDFTYIRKK